jgi:predicted kinase
VTAAFRGYVIVSGPPASGKSTLAAALASALDLPLLAKDGIKDALVDALGAPDVARSRELGRAAVQVLLAVARTSGRGVLESVWHGYAREPLAALPGPTVEVFCRCNPEVLRARFRIRSARRGAVYFDRQRTAAELWNAEIGAPVAAGWPVLEVDTGVAVDVAALACRIGDGAGRSSPGDRPRGATALPRGPSPAPSSRSGSPRTAT